MRIDNRVVSLAIVISIICASAKAEPPPPQIRSLLNKGSLKPGVQYVALADLEDGAFYWVGRVQKNGYFEVRAPTGYSTLISTLFAEPSLQRDDHPKNSPTRCRSLGPVYMPVGELAESTYRRNIFFSAPDSPESPNAMLTVWDYLLEGASIVVISDFLSWKIHGEKSAISRVISDGDDKAAIWKATWILGGKQYELYMPEKDTDEEKALAELISMSNSIDCP